MIKKILISIFVITLFMGVNSVFAADISGGESRGPDISGGDAPKSSPVAKPLGKLQNPLKVNSIEGALLLVVDIMVWLGICFAILAIIWVGFKFVMAQGNDQKITEAKNWFFAIIIGLAILISAKVIVEIVKQTLISAGVTDEKFWKP